MKIPLLESLIIFTFKLFKAKNYIEDRFHTTARGWISYLHTTSRTANLRSVWRLLEGQKNGEKNRKSSRRRRRNLIYWFSHFPLALIRFFLLLLGESDTTQFWNYFHHPSFFSCHKFLAINFSLIQLYMYSFEKKNRNRKKRSRKKFPFNPQKSQQKFLFGRS